MQVKVPLPLLQYEDKVIGPLTVKQFVYVVLGVGSAALVYFIFPPGIRFVGLVLAIPVGAVFISLAFLKINDRPIDVYIFSFLNLFIRPRYRVFKRVQREPREEPILRAVRPTAAIKGPLTRSRLEQLAHVMDTRGEVEERIVEPESKRAVEPIEATPIEEKIFESMSKIGQIISTVSKEVKPQEEKMAEPVVAHLTTKPIERYESVKQQLGLKEQSYGDILDMAYKYVEKQKAEES